jgi:hypothetical protein
MVVPGLSTGLLPMMPVKGISFSMKSDEPRRLALRNRHALALLHHPPPCTYVVILHYIYQVVYHTTNISNMCV